MICRINKIHTTLSFLELSDSLYCGLSPGLTKKKRISLRHISTFSFHFEKTIHEDDKTIFWLPTNIISVFDRPCFSFPCPARRENETNHTLKLSVLFTLFYSFSFPSFSFYYAPIFFSLLHPPFFHCLSNCHPFFHSLALTLFPSHALFCLPPLLCLTYACVVYRYLNSFGFQFM